MKKKIVLWFFLFSYLGILAQESNLEIDDKYLEDQFYCGITYNHLWNKAEKVTQHSLSHSFMGGFIRDIPLNKGRNIGLGIGLGYSYNKIYANIAQEIKDKQISYHLISLKDNKTFNRYSYHMVDIPVEFRWRTSTPYTHKFWRVYSGIRFSYIFSSIYQLDMPQVSISHQNTEFEKKILCQVYTALGHNTWNLYFQYTLTPLFSTQKVQTISLKSNIINIGLIFYIL